jgi:hypothetical protein
MDSPRNVGFTGLRLVYSTCVAGPTACVVSRPPPAPCKHRSPRLFRVQCGLTHPVIGAYMDEVQVSKVAREVFEGHPAAQETLQWLLVRIYGSQYCFRLFQEVSFI